jgi:hypothetical protein
MMHQQQSDAMMTFAVLMAEYNMGEMLSVKAVYQTCNFRLCV